MEKIVPLYGIAALMMLVAIFLALRSDGLFSHKLAKIRLRTVESRRRGFSEPREEAYEPGLRLEWLIIGAMLLLICMLLSKV